MPPIAYIKIHPAIGIARIGNAEVQNVPLEERQDFFIGPRIPSVVERPPGGYKIEGRIKRQAAEFRLFGYDKDHRLVGEVTADGAEIAWTVTLANTKASWLTFEGQNTGTPRNAGVKAEARRKLDITPPPQRLAGRKQGPARFDGGTFTGFAYPDGKPVCETTVPVPLGEILTDAQARLLVLGANGFSSSPVDASISTFANNDGWHDDLADGPVDADVRIDGREIPVSGAWVICTVPKYAPEMENFLTLYDTLHQTMVDRGTMPWPERTEFHADVLPILDRVKLVRWIMGIGAAHDFLMQKASQPDAPLPTRRQVLDRVRNPFGGSTGLQDMPMLLSDNNTWRTGGDAGLALTRIQYRHLERWADGDDRYSVGAPHTPRPDDPITPGGLDRAALENCCGGAFFPGMEASWMLRDTYAYSEPFRLSRLQPTSVTGRLEAGDAIKQMAVPWQADFLECRRNREAVYLPGYWPQQRPEMVTRFGTSVPVNWTRGIGTDDHLSMVVNWSRLGFVLARGDGYYEEERGKIIPPKDKGSGEA